MGAENYVGAQAAGKRSAKRARVLLAVKIQSPSGEIDGRLRDLSRKGALVECRTPIAVGSEVVFARGATSVPARVAWSSGIRVGLEFAFMIDEHEVFVQLGRTTADQNQPRFRRASLFGDMSATEKKQAQVWGRSVGIALPSE